MNEQNELRQADIEWCLHNLRSSDPDEREAAAAKLSFFGTEAARAIPALRLALSDSERGVRYAAGIALGAILESSSPAGEPAKAALVALGELFEDDSEESRRKAIAAVEHLEVALHQPPEPNSILTASESSAESATSFECFDPVTDDEMTKTATAHRFHRRASFALNSLKKEERNQVLETLSQIAKSPQSEWPASRLPGDDSDLLLRVSDTLRAIVRSHESGDIEVLDLVRGDTLKQFGALQDVH